MLEFWRKGLGAKVEVQNLGIGFLSLLFFGSFCSLLAPLFLVYQFFYGKVSFFRMAAASSSSSILAFLFFPDSRLLWDA